MLKKLINWILSFFRKSKVEQQPQGPPRVKLHKPLKEMSTAELQRAQDILDDFWGHMKFNYRPDQLENDAFRSLCALVFYGAWEAGFWDAYHDIENTACHNCALRAFEAGIKAGGARAMLWVPPAEAEE